MIRIETLPTGVLVVHGHEATSYVENIDQAEKAVISDELKTSFKLLRATDPGTTIEGVGVRVGERTYYLFEHDGDGDIAMVTDWLLTVHGVVYGVSYVSVESYAEAVRRVIEDAYCK